MLIGIDLGTTNSLVAYFTGDGTEIIPNRLGERLTPSVVSISEDGTVYVGKSGKERMLTKPDETVELFKRSMGTDREYNIHGKTYKAEDIASLVLRTLKEDAQNYLKTTIEEAVISVPAYFNNTQREATKKAGELAGLKVERIVSEPTAAAISYGLHKRTSNTKYLVFDLGGGTFDVSILEMNDTIMEVRAVAGDNFLGGEDFTDVLIRMFLNKYDIHDDDWDLKTINYVKKQAEKCKLGFSDSKVSTLKLRLNDTEYEYEIDIDEYERACQLLLSRIKKPIERSLKDAKVKLSDIDEVILVGGATKLSIVKKFVSKLFSRLPNVEINPDEVVARGVAIHAAMKERNEAIREIVLTDVCPFSLGTEVVPDGINKKDYGQFLPIIERNTVIPVSRTQTLYTATDGQERIRVRILQGESRIAKNNIFLGDICMKVPAKPAGAESVDVTYTYDVNSILEVVVKVNSTGKVKKMYIKKGTEEIEEKEIEQRFEELSFLKILPKDEEINKTVLFRAERLYEELLGEERHEMALHISAFENALETQDKQIVEEERKRITIYLDYIENSEN
ncbi:MAG: molecular chaperone HscC [Lachnospiraceae bacterium]|nr:molecular chaperone HscC [Lachnospiraceae bacterium]